MKLVFFGTPEFAVPALDALHAAGHALALVVAQPDAPAGRGQAVRSPAVAERARALGLPVAQPRAIKTGDFPAQLEGLGADLAVVIAYGRILTPRLLRAPHHGCINVHASLLPRWRGAAPIQWAILAGDAETGVCTQQMEEGLDTGPVLLSLPTAIAPGETAGALHDRLSALAAVAAVDTVARLSQLPPRPQDETYATWAPKIDREMGRVRWNRPADAVERRIRAMTPWPGGWVPWNEGPLRIEHCRAVDGLGSPGTVISLDPLRVACESGALELASVRAPGRKTVRGAEFAKSARLTIGLDLGGS